MFGYLVLFSVFFFTIGNPVFDPDMLTLLGSFMFQPAACFDRVGQSDGTFPVPCPGGHRYPADSQVHVQPSACAQANGLFILSTSRVWTAQHAYRSHSLAPVRSQIVDLVHPGRANVPKAEIREKLAKIYKASADAVFVFGVHTAFGGGRVR